MVYIHLTTVFLVATVFSTVNANTECGISSVSPNVYSNWNETEEELVNNYIIGGRDAKPGEFPWIAGLAIKISYSQFMSCGAAIWDNTTLLTAAHCLVSCDNGRTIYPRGVKICVGDFTKSKRDGEMCFIAKAMKVHENWNPCYDRNFRDDIAMLSLRQPLKIPDIKQNGYGSVNTACRPSRNDTYTGHAVINGWGKVDYATGRVADTLKMVSVPIWSESKCRRYWDVSSKQICVGGEEDESACQGDSGGPLVQYNDGIATLIGLTSYARVTCAVTGVPNVFTKVSAYLDWIDSNIESKYNWQPLGY